MRSNFIVTKIHRVLFIGKNEYPERTTSFPRDLRCNELILYLSGKATVLFNGKTLPCEQDTVRFLPKGKVTQYIVDRDEHGECIDIFFDTNVPVAEEAFVTKCQNSTAIWHLFKKIFSTWVGRTDGYYFKCMALLYEIFSLLQKERYIPDCQYQLIRPAIEYIDENFLDKKLSTPHLANLCGISESYLKKLFIKRFGLPPVKYIIQLKINYASDLLRYSLYNVTEVSELCGYKTVYYFSRQFTEYMGLSPTRFMEKYKPSK